MNERINDWRPETKSLIERLVAAGAEIQHGSNGEETFNWPSAVAQQDDFIEQLLACDEAHLNVRINGRNRQLYLVLGNSPGELVCDYSCDDVLDAVTDAHYTEWSEKSQPMRDAR